MLRFLFLSKSSHKTVRTHRETERQTERQTETNTDLSIKCASTLKIVWNFTNQYFPVSILHEFHLHFSVCEKFLITSELFEEPLENKKSGWRNQRPFSQTVTYRVLQNSKTVVHFSGFEICSVYQQLMVGSGFGIGFWSGI